MVKQPVAGGWYGWRQNGRHDAPLRLVQVEGEVPEWRELFWEGASYVTCPGYSDKPFIASNANLCTEEEALAMLLLEAAGQEVDG